MMKNQVEKLVKKGRRVMAFAMAVAMLMSLFSPASFAEAAKWKKPALSVKKKTLYYNKAGKKTYTLKVKKNNVKKIKKTTWKTSKKSVIAISKKKKTSVKLKAKKEGKATITATIKYVPKGMWMVRTLKLKCKVTSKKSGKSPKPSVKPTVQPSNVVKKVTLDSTKEILGTAAEKNTVTLTATVFNADGKEMDIDEDDIKWTSSSKKIATVDDEGNVTAVKAGTANITASYGGVKSSPCVIVVDSTAPEVKEAVVTNVNTIAVYFSEAVKGELEVSVEKKDEDSTEPLDSKKIKAVLAKDGKSMTVTYEEELPDGKYAMTIDGLSDMAGNELAEDTKVMFEKLPSTPAKLVGVTKQIPAGQKNAKVYFKVLDQYNKEMAFDADIIAGITADVATENGMPLEAKVGGGNEKYYVEISNTEYLSENKKLNINLGYNKTVTGKITVTIVKADGDVEKTVSISGFKVNNSDATTAYTHAKQNGSSLSIKAIFADELGSPAEPSAVSYRIDNTDVLTFEGGKANQTSENGEIEADVIKEGKATITAYLFSSEKSAQLTITVTEKVAIARIEVDDRIQLLDADDNVTSSISLSKGESVDLNNYKKIGVTFKAYDKNGTTLSEYDEEDFLRYMDSREGQVTGSEDYSARKKNAELYYQEFLINFKDSGVIINDKVEITITYPETEITTTVTIPVSNEASEAKLNECEIVRKDYEEKNLCNETYEMNFAEKNKPLEFKVQTTDQYGAVVNNRFFSTIKSSNEDVAEVKVDDTNIFTITPNRLGEATITVYVTRDITRTFTIKVVEEINVVDEFKKKADILAEDYYSSSDDEQTLEKKNNKNELYFKIPIKGGASINKEDIKGVFLGDIELLSESNPSRVSVGKNRFITLPDYQVDESNLLISYLFVALNNVDKSGKMKFTIKFNDESKAEAVLKVTELNKDLKCTAIKPSLGNKATVKIASGRDKDKELNVTTAGELISTSGIRECTLELTSNATNNTWKHMVLLKFEVDSTSDYKPLYYFTKKVVGKTVSYGFTEAEATGELGYYPYNYDSLKNGEKITDYTVATVDRHSVSNIKLIQKQEQAQTAVSN